MVLPAYPGYSQGLRRAGPYGGYLGSQYNPLCTVCDPDFGRTIDANRDFYDPTYRPMGDPELPGLPKDVTLDALDRRVKLLEQVDQSAARLDSGGTRLMSQKQREALELKVWRDKLKDPLAKGLAQLDGYLDRCGLDTGVLVIFDRRPKAKSIEARTRFTRAVSPAGRKIRVLRA